MSFRPRIYLPRLLISEGLILASDTLILQLGYILNTVPAWRKAYKLRVLVFVEYENEVEEETARVKALLDKLRIDAETHVFWLACGELHTYECIINGHCEDIDSEIMVNETLRDEDWWDELLKFRGRPDSMNHSQEMNSLATILDATSRRPGVYNPHADMDELAKRRGSVIDLPNGPSVVNLSRFGVNVGIHTHHLGEEMFEEQIDQLDHPDTDGEDWDEESDREFSDSEASAASEGDRNGMSSSQPLLDRAHRRRSFADILAIRAPERKSKSKTPSRSILKNNDPGSVSYGTMEPPAPVEKKPSQSSTSGPSNTGNRKRGRSGKSSRAPTVTTTPTESGRMTPEASETIRPLLQTPQGVDDDRPPRTSVDKGRVRPPVQRLQSAHHSREPSISQSFAAETPPAGAPKRPGMSRQSSAVRFTSRPMPETKTNVEDHLGPTIMFAESVSGPAAPQMERPAFSRQSSTGRLNNRLAPDEKSFGGEGAAGTSLPGSRHHSRKGSSYSDFGQRIDIPELLGSYKFDTPKEDSNEEGSTYSTQSIALSFNDLPSRAQHLILNELIRRNSGDTALTFTTLPVPSDGTSLDEEATLAYLSDVEVLCNDLPPVLLVLSNNMTVTVGL